MDFITWLELASLCLLGAMSPGPSLAVVVRQTLSHGRAHGVAAALAHGVVSGLYALATVQGLALVFSTEPWLFRAMTWGGAAYLCWLGLQNLRAGVHPVTLSAAMTPRPLWRSAQEALLVALGNPHLVVFFLALFSQFVQANSSWSDQLIMVLTAGLLDIAWYTLLAFGLSHRSILLLLQRHMHWVNRTTGLVLLLLCARILTL